MNPLHMQHGRYYWTTTCATSGCGSKLAIAEVDPRAPSDESERKKAEIIGVEVRCPSCTKTTIVSDRKLIFTEVR
jgi:cytochrome c-type biogenesis protein CcmH/NrfF